MGTRALDKQQLENPNEGSYLLRVYFESIAGSKVCSTYCQSLPTIL